MGESGIHAHSSVEHAGTSAHLGHYVHQTHLTAMAFTREYGITSIRPTGAAGAT
jgi:hypothetical protein